jgi:hypothetical protein
VVFAGSSPRDHQQTPYQEQIRREVRDRLRNPPKPVRQEERNFDFIGLHPNIPAQRPAWWSPPRPPGKRSTPSRSFGARRYVAKEERPSGRHE